MIYQYRPGKSRATTLRKKMIAKHGNCCMNCGYPGGFIEMHHIDPVSNGGDHIADNVILLCEKCHMEAHGWNKKNYIDKNRENWPGQS